MGDIDCGGNVSSPWRSTSSAIVSLETPSPSALLAMLCSPCPCKHKSYKMMVLFSHRSWSLVSSSIAHCRALRHPWIHPPLPLDVVNHHHQSSTYWFELRLDKFRRTRNLKHIYMDPNPTWSCYCHLGLRAAVCTRLTKKTCNVHDEEELEEWKGTDA
jgi:hypothetical protein